MILSPGCRGRALCGRHLLPGSGTRCFLFRTRRRQAREQTGKMADHLEGLSSDDEETSTDITNFNLEKGQTFIWK